jgi:hypothetical protein
MLRFFAWLPLVPNIIRYSSAELGHYTIRVRDCSRMYCST